MCDEPCLSMSSVQLLSCMSNLFIHACTRVPTEIERGWKGLDLVPPEISCQMRGEKCPGGAIRVISVLIPVTSPCHAVLTVPLHAPSPGQT